MPEPSISGPNNNSAKVVFSSYLPSPGFTTKYDPEGEFIAIGCNSGDKLLYSISESKKSTNVDKILQKISDPSETPVTCIRYITILFRWRPGKSKHKVIGVCLADGHF